MSAATSAYAIPAIDLDGTGVTVVRTADATRLDIRVKVIDFESSDHNVTVTTPLGGDIQLKFESSQGDSYYYSGEHPLTEEYGLGDYSISAVNHLKETGTATDTVEKHDMDFPDPYLRMERRRGGGTAAEFDWEDIPGAALYQLEIYDSEGDQVYKLNTTDSGFATLTGKLKAGPSFTGSDKICIKQGRR